MKKYELYKESQQRFMKQTEGKRHGFCNWEMYHDNFKLECWNIEGDDGNIEPTIIQLWQDGNGYSMYRAA